MNRLNQSGVLGICALLLVMAGCGDDSAIGECGDGIQNEGELCDGSDLAGATCASLGHPAGDLTCTGECTFDFSGCGGDTCGDDVLDTGEDCDNAELGGATCVSLGYGGGTLDCAMDCSFDESGCTATLCGNDVIDTGEDCDDTNLGGLACEDLGYDSGTLSCAGDCSFDVSVCTGNPCGNGTIDLAEDCEGTNLDGATCASVGHTGGTLACGGDCQFDESACTDCGNGTVETGEVCESGDLGGQTCIGLGYDAGTLACNATCDGFDETGCCDNGCTALNDERCSGTWVQTCVQSGVCLDWTNTTDCAPNFCGGSPPVCQASGTGAACDDLYLLNGRVYPHTVTGLWASGAIANPGTCQTGAHALYLAYTLEAGNPGRLILTSTDGNTPAAFPQGAAFSTTQSGTFCDPAQRTELGCVVGTTSTSSLVADTSSLSQGDTVYFLVSGNGLSYPLLDPQFTVEEIDCTQPAQVSLLDPNPPTDVHPRTDIRLNFTGDQPLQNAGLVRLYDGTTLLATYNLVTNPPEVSFSGNTMTINPAFDFALGANISVQVDLIATLCNTAISDALTFTVATTLPPTGEACFDALTLTPGVNTTGVYTANTLDVLNTGLASCYSGYAGTVDSVWSFTLPAPNTAVEIILDKSADNRLVAVLLDDCNNPVSAQACVTEWTATSLTLTAGQLTPGATYYLVIGDAYSTVLFPDPLLTQIELIPVNPVCGNSTIDVGEQCDDSNAASGDGCSSACVVEPDWECTGEPSACNLICSNGILDAGEVCDDGNLAAGDGCSPTCFVEQGYTCVGEPSTCTLSCGNGIINASEQCDDLNTTSGDGCSATCGVEPGWECFGQPSTCTFVCGDGVLDVAEGCDDGNLVVGDGCSEVCNIEAGYFCQGQPSTCNTATLLLEEEFSTWPPAGWTIEDGGGTTDTWTHCDGCPGAGITGAPATLLGANGAYAFVDDDTPGTGVSLVEGLVTPSFATTGHSNVWLQFRHYYHGLGNSVGEVQISVNNGPYVTLTQYVVDSVNGEFESIDLSPFGANAPNVRIRFFFDDFNEWAWYWLIDSVRIVGF